MKHLIVLAHPNQKSFGKAIADRILATAKAKGDEVVIRDLYEMKFNPILNSEDFVSFKAGIIPADIKREQDHITWADNLIWVYPIWWSRAPAIMEGYVDRVFSNGFAYKASKAGVVPLLVGKQASVIATAGNSQEYMESSGISKAIEHLNRFAIFEFCGISKFKQIFFYNATSTTPDNSEAWLKQIDEYIKSLKK